MWSELAAFAAGVFLAPAVRPLLRPAAVEVVKVTMVAIEEARKISEDVREDLEDAMAQAKAEHAARHAASSPPRDGDGGAAPPSSA